MILITFYDSELIVSAVKLTKSIKVAEEFINNFWFDFLTNIAMQNLL